MAKTITLVKGPAATGKVFGFRYAAGTAANRKAGRIEVGDKPTTIRLDTPEAVKAKLEQTLDGLIGQQYLKVAEGKTAKAESSESP